jgi:hypothetical protein
MIVALLAFVIILTGTVKVAKSEKVTINSGVDAITFLQSAGVSFDHVFTDADFLSA